MLDLEIDIPAQNAAAQLYEDRMAQGADQAEGAMDCDAEFKTAGHPFIGLEIRVVDDDQASSVGKVTGWLSAAEADFLDEHGQPAALFHVAYTAGALAGAEEDLELYEIVDSITAVPFTAPDEGQQKQLRELYAIELAEPDGARSGTQLANRAVELNLFTLKSKDAMRAWIRKAQLVSDANKDTRNVAGHAKKTLASLEAKDVTALEGDFVAACPGLMCSASDSKKNNHPLGATLLTVYVRIKGDGGPEAVAEATTEALHAGLAVLSYHEAHGREQLEELERTNPARHAAVMIYRKKFEGQKVLEIDGGWGAGGIEGVRRTRRHGKPDILTIHLVGPHWGKEREDTEQGLKDIKRMVEETQSEDLQRRAARKEADAELASGATTLQQKVVEQGITFAPPEQREALGDDAPVPSS